MHWPNLPDARSDADLAFTDAAAAKVMFVGIAAVGGEVPGTANISGIVLSR